MAGDFDNYLILPLVASRLDGGSPDRNGWQSGPKCRMRINAAYWQSSRPGGLVHPLKERMAKLDLKTESSVICALMLTFMRAFVLASGGGRWAPPLARMGSVPR